MELIYFYIALGTVAVVATFWGYWHNRELVNSQLFSRE